MKSVISKSMMCLAMVITLLSFSTKPGGEGFEIYLDNKLVVQRYGNQINAIQSLQLNQADGSNLFIRYNHCGKAGKDRVITIRDDQHKMLREFRYADAKSPGGMIMLELKEVYKLRKEGVNSLQLYYAANELPDGRLLTNIVF